MNTPVPPVLAKAPAKTATGVGATLSTGEQAQLAQFVDSTVRVTGQAPDAGEVADFLARRGLVES